MQPRPPVTGWSGIARDGMPVQALRGRHDRPIPIHAHDFWELQLCERGTARHHTADGHSLFRRGSVVLLRPGAWHGKDLCHGLVSWACCWQSALLSGFGGSDPRISGLLAHDAATWTGQLDEAGVRRYLAHLQAIPTSSGVARCALLVLLLDILAGPPALAAPLLPDGALRVLADIDAYPERPWSAASAARAAGLSQTHFTRCCRAATGLAPLAHITRRRLERAAALLLAGELPAATVAERCGFADPGYFARCFRRHHGCPPSAWRRLVQARTATRT